MHGNSNAILPHSQNATIPKEKCLDKRLFIKAFYYLTGGEGGIRTPGSFDRTPDFESGTFDHSDKDGQRA